MNWPINFFRLKEEHFTFRLQYKHSVAFANCKYEELSYPKKFEHVRPHFSNSIENATTSDRPPPPRAFCPSTYYTYPAIYLISEECSPERTAGKIGKGRNCYLGKMRQAYTQALIKNTWMHPWYTWLDSGLCNGWSTKENPAWNITQLVISTSASCRSVWVVHGPFC